MTFWVSAVNVRYRDVQHLIGLALLVWFWFTPIVYPGASVQQKLTDNPVLGINLWNVFVANPLAAIVFGFQRALYWVVSPVVVKDGVSQTVPVLPDVSLVWLIGLLVAVLVGCTLLLMYTWWLFFRLSGDFAEEL
jgi:ABC-2 type transport system permease protein